MATQMNLDWIRCNNCYLMIASAKKAFSLLQCGHVYCRRCCKQAVKKCPVCNSVGQESTPLQEPMVHPTIVPFFSTISDSLGLLLRVADFHYSQMKILLQRLKDFEKKYESMKEAYRHQEGNVAYMEDYVIKIQNQYIQSKQDKKHWDKNFMMLEKKYMQFRSMLKPPSAKYSTPSIDPSQRANSLKNRSDSSSPSSSFYEAKSMLSPFSTPRVNPVIPLAYDGPFLMPTITRVPKSAGTKSSRSSGSSSNTVILPNSKTGYERLF